MDIPALLTVVETLALLTSMTGRAWTRAGFFGLVVDLALPMRSITPSNAYPVVAVGADFVSAQLPYRGRRLAVLSTPQVKDLWLYGQAETRLVALEPGEPGYLDWEMVKARRAAVNRVGDTPEAWNVKWPDADWHDGELMGECGVSQFNEAVRVTDETCRVPAETVKELLAFSATQSHDIPIDFTRYSDGSDGLSAPNKPLATHGHSPHAETLDMADPKRPTQASEKAALNAADSLAGLFDPVTPAVLERMIPSGGKWADWCERAARNGLKEAREGRGKFNPFRAAVWFLGQGQPDWDLARCYRVLARNLPPRSRGDEHRLTGLLD